MTNYGKSTCLLRTEGDNLPCSTTFREVQNPTAKSIGTAPKMIKVQRSDINIYWDVDHKFVDPLYTKRCTPTSHLIKKASNK